MSELSGGLSWQGGWDEPGVLSVVIVTTGAPGTGIFVYSGTPGPGNQPVASLTAATTDPYGNTVKAGGLTIYSGSQFIELHVSGTTGGPAMELATGAGSEAENATLYATVVNSGLVNELIELNLLGPGSTFDNAQALLQLVSSAKDGSALARFNAIGPVDANKYSIGQQILNAQTTTINAITGITITGLSTNVAPGSYYIRSVLRCVAAASGVTQVMAPRLSGTATPSGTPWRIFTNEWNESAPASANTGNISGFNSDPSVLPGAIGNGFVFNWTLEGIVTFSAGGTFLVQARQVTSAADETFTVQNGSFLLMMPV